MGRWAQRRRRGGGGPSETQTLARMTSAMLDGTALIVTVTYTGNVTAAAFNTTDFLDVDESATPVSIAQGATNEAILTFELFLNNSDTLVYTGTAAGVLTPDSATLSI